MTPDDIIKMAKQAKLPHEYDTGRVVYLTELERFAALVAAAEREAIAQSLDKQADLAGDPMDREWAQEMAAAIRARSRT